MSFEENQEKCIYCGSVDLRETVLGGGDSSAMMHPVNENGKIGVTGLFTKFVRVRAKVCKDCGNISRWFVDGKDLQKLK
jgi:hypothetical protein